MSAGTHSYVISAGDSLGGHRAQLIAGLDIVTDGDARFTQDIGGQSNCPRFSLKR